MSSQDRARLKEVLWQAHCLVGSERAEYLARAGAGDGALLKQVEEMLAALDHAGDFLREPTVSAPIADHGRPVLGEAPGTCIGPYKLLQVIGEGGFGSVYMAEQQEPVVRRVALKIIKLGMDTRQVIARFEAERQALALMDHPNIARVLDAGATATGRPYFVMELVRGEPITQYCDKNNLSTWQRLALFMDVCHAVQHAHTKGIIHRDLKPSNILVTVHDARPLPKVIDFGIAKALHQRLTARTLFTEHRALVGTPEYMSPEQAEMGASDIDTRSDIYSLGVLLYELLTGVTPLDARSLRSAAFAEMQRIIREEEPPKPSTRLSTSDMLASVAACRMTEPRRLSTLVRGDLDWIVMKCLEKDRTRRYETANGLAMDVQRHLAAEPIVAAPPSNGYRLRKFVQRNKGPVAAAAAVLLVLVGGIAGTTAGFLSAHARAESEAEAKLAAIAAANLAKQRQQETRKVAAFQARMLADFDPTAVGLDLMRDIRVRSEAALAKQGVSEALRKERAARLAAELREVNATDTAVALIDRTILKPAILAIDKEFKGQPLVYAALQQTLADLYARLGMFDAARAPQERALDIRRREMGEDDPDAIVSMGNMGALLQSQGNYSEAERMLREALQKARRVLGDDNADTMAVLGSMGAVLTSQCKYAEAEPVLREALERVCRVQGEEHPDALTALNNLGGNLLYQGKLAEADRLLREALQKRRQVLGEEHADTIESIAALATLLKAEGELSEAEDRQREALEKSRRALGEEHPTTLAVLTGLGQLLITEGKLPEAELLLKDSLEKRRRILGDDKPATIASIGSLATVLQSEGDFDRAEPLFREALERSKRVFGDQNAETLKAMGNLGIILWYQRKPALAEPYTREALEKSRLVLGDDNPQTLCAACNMGTVLSDLGRPAEAEKYYRESLDGRRKVLGDENPETLISLGNVGYILQAQGKYSEAEPYMRDTLQLRRRKLGDENPETILSMHNLGFVLLSMHRPEEAEPLYREVLERRRRVPGEGNRDTLGAIVAMADLLIIRGKLAEAEPLCQESLEKCRRFLGEQDAETIGALHVMAKLLEAQGKLDLAAPCYQEVLDARRRTLEPDHPLTLAAMHNLGSLLRSMGRWEDAERLLLAAAASGEAKLPPADPGRRRLVGSLARLYGEWDKAEPGKGYGAKSAEWKARLDVVPTPPPVTGGK